MTSCASFLIICLVLPFVLTFSVDNEKSSRPAEQLHEVTSRMELFETQSSDADPAEEPSIGKINWAPVWDDIETSNEILLKHEIADENCAVTPGKGLDNLIKKAYVILPTQQISDIIQSFAKDPEFKGLKEFLHSPKYKNLRDALKNTEEFKLLQSYLCNILHLDISHLLTTCINLSSDTEEQSYTGIKDLFERLVGIVPRDRLKELYQRLRHSDEDLLKAEANLKSPEFQQLLLNLRNAPAYMDLMAELKSLGVPIDDIRNYIEKIFKKL